MIDRETFEEAEPHGLSPTEFVGSVHSFEFWFRAVEGYLHDRTYGYRDNLADHALSEPERNRLITTLCNYCIAEMTALDGASGMVRFAPNRNAKIFLATQVVDEARHLEVFVNRLTELGVADPEAEIERRANDDLLAFKERFDALVQAGDWNAAVLAQNVVLETMEFTVFTRHARSADPITADVLGGVISDERRHFGFGENDLGRRLAREPKERARLEVIRQELDALVLRSLESTMAAIGLPVAERGSLGREYLQAIERLGLDR